MIFFADNDGTITSSVPSPVYQGSANVNNIYLVAPFTVNSAVAVAFILPNGVVTERYLMTPIKELEGIVNEKTSEKYSVWSYSPDISILQRYGTVTVQFFFYASQDGVITATSSTSFSVGKGVPSVLPPDNPSADIYNAILNHLTYIQEQIDNSYQAGFADEMLVETETLQAGKSAQVEVTPVPDTPSTAKAFKFNFGIPKGDKGDRGLALWVGIMTSETSVITQSMNEVSPKNGEFVAITSSNIGDSYIGNVYIIREVMQRSENTYFVTINQADLAGNIRGAQGATGQRGLYLVKDFNPATLWATLWAAEIDPQPQISSQALIFAFSGDHNGEVREIIEVNGANVKLGEYAFNIKGEKGDTILDYEIGVNYDTQTGETTFSSVVDYEKLRSSRGLNTYVTLQFDSGDVSVILPFASFIESPNHGEGGETYYNIEYNDGTNKVVISTCDDGHNNSVTYSTIDNLKASDLAVGTDGKIHKNLIPDTASSYNIGGRTKPIKGVYANKFIATYNSNCFTAIHGEASFSDYYTRGNLNIGIGNITRSDGSETSNYPVRISMDAEYNNISEIWEQAELYITSGGQSQSPLHIDFVDRKLDLYDKVKVTPTGVEVDNFYATYAQLSAGRYRMEISGTGMTFTSNRAVTTAVDFREMPCVYIRMQSKNLGDASGTENDSTLVVPNSFDFVFIGGRGDTKDTFTGYFLLKNIDDSGVHAQGWQPCSGRYTDADGNVHSVRGVNIQLDSLSFALDDRETGSLMYAQEIPLDFVDGDTKVCLTVKKINHL